MVRTREATLLLDCGLFQGRRAESRRRNVELGLDPERVDAVVPSHAHIDHSGALPLLCKQGYSGPIYATPATRDLCAVMLQDAAMIQAADARYLNRAIERDGLDADPIEPLYDQTDSARAVATQATAMSIVQSPRRPAADITFIMPSLASPTRQSAQETVSLRQPITPQGSPDREGLAGGNVWRRARSAAFDAID